MNKILCLETATKNCSVAIFETKKLLSKKEEYHEQYSHSENLTVFIQEALQKANLGPKELDAICVGKGPGSYTGLRIGAAVAKGMAYALNIPLISLSTHQILFDQVFDSNPGYDLYVPMVDARRMEVYQSVFDTDKNMIEPITAQEIDRNSFDHLSDKKVLLFGDGADKFTELFKGVDHINILPEIYVSAGYMGDSSYDKFVASQFEDPAYFEPFYLKEFIAGKPKKLFT